MKSIGMKCVVWTVSALALWIAGGAGPAPHHLGAVEILRDRRQYRCRCRHHQCRPDAAVQGQSLDG